MMSGRFQTAALPRLEQVCVPMTIWWPGQRAGSPPEIPVARAQARLEWLDESGPLAPLDRADDLAARLQVELFQPVRVVGG
jgi:hypothetical protein